MFNEVNDFQRNQDLYLTRREKNKAVRRLTKACESVMWMKTKDIRKRFEQDQKGTLDIGSDVQIDLVGFHNDISLKITIKNCLVNGLLIRIFISPFIKIFSILLELVFLPAMLFTNVFKYVGNYVRSRLKFEQHPAAGPDILEIQGEEPSDILHFENLEIPDQNENLTTTSNQSDQIHEVPHIEHETGTCICVA